MTRLAVVIVLIGCCCLAARTRASAIPMWEFLTREEKVRPPFFFTRRGD